MDGLLIIDKPIRISSFDVLRQLRKKLGAQKMGYLGTLDPLATGVLVVFLNKATKLIKHFEGLDKEYVVEFEFGKVSETYDSTGTIVKASGDLDSHVELVQQGQIINDQLSMIKLDFSLEQIESVILKHQGKMLQETPKFSAVKRMGKRAYELAREGVMFDLGKRQVEVKEVEVLESVFPRYEVRLVVTSGTYVRSWVHEVGEISKLGAVMTGLRRTRVGDWRLEDAVGVDEVNEADLIDYRAVVKRYGIR
jgi:tRNA pseudouridine55 synthase